MIRDIKGRRYSVDEEGVVFYAVSDTLNALVIPDVLMKDVKGMKIRRKDTKDD